MQIKVNKFDQELYEKSVTRVAQVLSLEDRRAVRDTLIVLKDAIDNALELQKRLDTLDLTVQQKRAPQPKPVAEKTEEPEVVEEPEYTIDTE